MKKLTLFHQTSLFRGIGKNPLTGPNLAISIVYNGDGDRVQKTVNGVTTKYLVDRNNLTGYAQVVEEIQNGQVIRQYTYGLDLISERQLINGTYQVSFYGYDGHGSVRYLTDANGNVTDTYDYDAFGVLINQTGSTPNSYLYAGEQYDADLGLYYNRARYLEVGRGRFWSQDSYEGNKIDPISLHKYLYVANNPTNLIDPSGNSFIETLTAFVIRTILIVGPILFLTDRVRAPSGDPINDNISKTQADYDDAKNQLIFLALTAARPVLLASLNRLGAIASNLRAGGAPGYFEEIPGRSGAMVPQINDVGCGAACGGQILREEGVEVYERQLLTGLGEKGLTPEQLARNLNGFSPGWRGGSINGNIFKQIISIGKPFLAKLYSSSVGYRHYVIVDGIKAETTGGEYIQKVIIRDPAEGFEKLVPLQEFIDNVEGAVFRNP